jgi:hypothetical protein
MQEFSDLQIQSERYGETYNRNGRKTGADCTVKALAACFDLSYGKAQRTMTKAGRVFRKGANVIEISRGIEIVTGEDYESIKGEFVESMRGKKLPTLNQFCKENPKGAFYAIVSGHALCIRDGRLIDWTADSAGRRKVKYVYKVKS